MSVHDDLTVVRARTHAAHAHQVLAKLAARQPIDDGHANSRAPDSYALGSLSVLCDQLAYHIDRLTEGGAA